MLAPWNRGTPSARSTGRSPPLAATRRAAAAAAMTVLAGLAAVQVGCDSPENRAAKEVRAAVAAAADAGKVSVASDPAVGTAAKEAGLDDQAQGSLATLGARDSRSPETVQAWEAEQAKLGIRQRQAIAAALRTVGHRDQEALRKQLEQAVSTAGAPPEALVDPYARLADLDTAAGDALAQDAASKAVEAATLAQDLHRLVGQLRLNAAQASRLNSLNPQASLAALDELQKRVTGADANADWIGTGPAAMPSGAKVDAQVAAAEEAAKKLEADKAAAEGRITKLTADAEALDAEARGQTGDLALNKALEAAKLRAQAAEQRIKADEAQSGIDAKRQEVAVLQTHRPAIKAAGDLIERQRKVAQDRWAVAQAQVKAVTDASTTLVGSNVGDAGAGATSEVTLVSPGATSTTRPAAAAQVSPAQIAALTAGDVIARKVAQMKEAARQADELRKQAGDLYTVGTVHNGKARDAANAVAQAIGQRQQSAGAKGSAEEALAGRLDLLDKSQFDYRDAVLHGRLARLSGERVLGLSILSDARQEAEDAIKAAGTDTTPAFLAELPNRKDVAEELKKADDEFAQAEAKIRTVIGLSAPGGEGGGDASAEAPAAVASSELATTAGQMKRAAAALLVNLRYAKATLSTLAGWDPNVAEANLAKANLGTDLGKLGTEAAKAVDAAKTASLKAKGGPQEGRRIYEAMFAGDPFLQVPAFAAPAGPSTLPSTQPAGPATTPATAPAGETDIFQAPTQGGPATPPPATAPAAG